MGYTPILQLIDGPTIVAHQALQFFPPEFDPQTSNNAARNPARDYTEDWQLWLESPGRSGLFS